MQEGSHSATQTQPIIRVLVIPDFNKTKEGIVDIVGFVDSSVWGGGDSASALSKLWSWKI